MINLWLNSQKFQAVHEKDKFWKKLDADKIFAKVKDKPGRISKIKKRKQKVVVHCYMGMERSVLSVVWYMHKYLGMGIDQAYEQIFMNRPIAADRRHWIGL